MLTEHEIDVKLVKHGLPTWGTKEQKLARLERNGIVQPEKMKVVSEYRDESAFDQEIEHKKIGKVISTYVDSDFSNNGQPHDVVVSDAPAPRKMGRPKKVK